MRHVICGVDFYRIAEFWPFDYLSVVMAIYTYSRTQKHEHGNIIVKEPCFV